MADNTTLPGAGAVIASDDIGGVQYQRIKPTHGVAGVAVDVSASDPMPVTDQTAVALAVLNDTMLYMLSAILEKMPRVTGNDQAAVSIESGSVGIAASQTLATLSNITSIGGKPASTIPDAVSQMGALHLYQNIIVS